MAQKQNDDVFFWGIIAIFAILFFGEVAAYLIMLFFLWLILMEVTRK